jgi:hypothetical protein
VEVAPDGRQGDVATVASSAAIPEPNTLTASTHRPGAEE